MARSRKTNEQKELKGMHDSGKRQQFNTGAVRDAAEDKPRPELISPLAIIRVGHWLKLGAQKYGEGNWTLGMPFMRVIASIIRHTLAYMLGRKKEDHLAAIATNAIFLMHYEEMIKLGRLPKELDNRWNYWAIDWDSMTSDAVKILKKRYGKGPRTKKRNNWGKPARGY